METQPMTVMGTQAVDTCNSHTIFLHRLNDVLTGHLEKKKVHLSIYYHTWQGSMIGALYLS